jgi:hypothetical protein
MKSFVKSLGGLAAFVVVLAVLVFARGVFYGVQGKPVPKAATVAVVGQPA